MRPYITTLEGKFIFVDTPLVVAPRSDNGASIWVDGTPITTKETAAEVMLRIQRAFDPDYTPPAPPSEGPLLDGVRFLLQRYKTTYREQELAYESMRERVRGGIYETEVARSTLKQMDGKLEQMRDNKLKIKTLNTLLTHAGVVLPEDEG